MKKSDLGTYPEMLKSSPPYEPFDEEDPDYEADLDNYNEWEEYPEPYMEDMFPKAKYFDDRDSAWEYLILKKEKAQIYTEIEGDTGGTWYDRGFHLVNRTGNYAVVIDSRFRPMIYTGRLEVSDDLAIDD